METHVIVGAGPVGSTTARLLADRGEAVRLVTRSGSGPDHTCIERVAADATDADRLSELSRGAVALYNCANPPYHRWDVDWPPLASSLLTATERSGAVLAITGNLYGYGPGASPMREGDPPAATDVRGKVRTRMWNDAVAAHEAGRIRVTEVRASDFVGPGVTQSHLGETMLHPVLAGKAARVVGDPDTLHSWTYVPDLARALVALAGDARAWGRPWHVPTNPTVSQRAALTAIAAAVGAPTPRLKPAPGWLLRAIGIVSKEARGLGEMAYQFESDFVLDSSLTETTFGLAPTPWSEVVEATASWWAERVGLTRTDRTGRPDPTHAG